MEDGQKVLIEQTRSTIGRDDRSRLTLEAMGLGRIGRKKEIVLNPATRGMMRSVRHLLKITPAQNRGAE